jgi:hypothetical protein
MSAAMTNYPIANHALIGDLFTAALVTSDGTIDWFCCPRLSPGVGRNLPGRNQQAGSNLCRS